MRVLAILGAEQKESLKRLEYGIKSVDSDILILSGMDKKMEEYARKLGYKGQIILKNSSTTHSDARNIREIVKKIKDWEKIYVATSNYHVPSCKIIFSAYFHKIPYEIIPLSTCSSTKDILMKCTLETLSVIKDIALLYLCRLNRDDVYEKTLGKIRNSLIRKILREKL